MNWHSILSGYVCGVFGAALALSVGDRRRSRRKPSEMYGVQLHDEWLAKDQEFIQELSEAVQASYRRRYANG